MLEGTLIREQLDSGIEMAKGYRHWEIVDLKRLSQKELEGVLTESVVLYKRSLLIVRKLRNAIASDRHEDSRQVILGAGILLLRLVLDILPSVGDLMVFRLNTGQPLESIRGGTEILDCIEACAEQLEEHWQTPGGTIRLEDCLPERLRIEFKRIEANRMRRMRSDFKALASRWVEETGIYSLSHQINAHPAYRAIIDLGPGIVPLVIEELRGPSPRQWMHVLRELTGADPVPAGTAGNLSLLTAAWLSWWESRKAAS